ncbi:hypothetical protein ACQP2H_30580 [Micromonospora sp. CA-248260]|uniref:hypothetical protein n=1 Tax=Micromonospora sp. CA-248260 TaxID=3239962 RepID=UPI003D8F5064
MASRRDEVVEPVAEVQARVRDQHANVLDKSFLGAMEAFVAEVVDSYELRGPQVLAPVVVRERRRV